MAVAVAVVADMTPEHDTGTIARNAEFRDTMTQLRYSAEQSLGKILDKKQVGRLKQIQLQLDPAGPWVVLREDMIEKLNMTEEQVAQLNEIRDGQRQKRARHAEDEPRGDGRRDEEE